MNFDYNSILKGVNEGSLTLDEIKIIDYIKKNESINNQQSRDDFGFGKDKNISLFNSLIKKGKIKREGSSNSTMYVLR